MSEEQSTPQPDPQPGWYCVRCGDVVKTTTATGQSNDPFGNFSVVTSGPICAICGANVVRYTTSEMARLLKCQMQLLDEGKRVDEMARNLRHQLDQKTLEIEGLLTRYWHPDTDRIIKRSETAAAGIVGRVRIGWQGLVFSVDEDGLRAAKAYFLTLASAHGGASHREVEDLKQEVASLKARLAAAQRGTEPSRSRRSIGL